MINYHDYLCCSLRIASSPDLTPACSEASQHTHYLLTLGPPKTVFLSLFLCKSCEGKALLLFGATWKYCEGIRNQLHQLGQQARFSSGACQIEARMLCCVSQRHVHPAVRGMAAALAVIPGVPSELAPRGANHEGLSIRCMFSTACLTHGN